MSDKNKLGDQKTGVNAIATDEYAGKAGSYLIDPITGQRTPKDRPKETDDPIIEIYEGE